MGINLFWLSLKPFESPDISGLAWLRDKALVILERLLGKYLCPE